MENIIFTIIEEEESNGKIIGERLAKELSIPFYEKEIIEIASKESKISEDVFYMIEDGYFGRFSYPLSLDFSSCSSHIVCDFLSLEDRIFMSKLNVVKHLSRIGDCVIFCKCSNYMLRNMENCINVLIYSKDTDRIMSVKSKYFFNDKKAKRYLNKKDKKLNRYYEYFTSDKWDNKKQYDLLINSSKICINDIVKILKDLYMRKSKENM